MLSGCWHTERHAPSITVVSSTQWKAEESDAYDVVVLGPVGDNRLAEVLRSLEPSVAIIICAPTDSGEMQQLRSRYPRLVQVPLREDWTQTLVLVAGESLQRVHAGRQAKQAISRAAKSESEAILGRYISESTHSVGEALALICGSA